MPRDVFKIRGVVIREVNVGEADKLLTVLTSERGKLTVRAYGARSIKSRKIAASQCLCCSDMDIAVSRGGLSLTDAAVVEGFYNIKNRLESIALSQYFLYITDSLTGEDIPDDGMMPLLLNALYALSGTLFADSRIKSCFELRAMAQCGYMPELDTCGMCGCVPSKDDEGLSIDIRGGFVLCGECTKKTAEAVPGTTGVSDTLTPIPYAALQAMRHTVSCDIKRLFSFRLADEADAVFCDICEKYACERLECVPRTLTFYKSIAESDR